MHRGVKRLQQPSEDLTALADPMVSAESTKETCKAIYVEGSRRIPIKENKAESRDSLDAYAK